MHKQLLLKFDNTTFNDDQELLSYIKQNYVTELDVRDIRVDELINKVQDAFPKFKVTIENGKGWYCDYKVSIRNKLMNFEERLGNNENPHISYDKNLETIEDVIKSLKHRQEIAQYIIDEVNKIGEFNIECTRHSEGYSSDEESYEFTFEVSGEERHTYFHPYNKDKDEFIKEFYQYVLTSIEGKLKKVYDEGYFNGYEIDGVPIEGFDGKSVRLEVI
ncbi:hypothetical protein [Brevibacillus sp. NRS-1366]|uniref:hypothetical protein n=1 Tax=Brevibacillus sp. NRS-1366 TaxID=3233899 RepID=UPI003D1CC82A